MRSRVQPYRLWPVQIGGEQPCDPGLCWNGADLGQDLILWSLRIALRSRPGNFLVATTPFRSRPVFLFCPRPSKDTSEGMRVGWEQSVLVAVRFTPSDDFFCDGLPTRSHYSMYLADSVYALEAAERQAKAATAAENLN